MSDSPSPLYMQRMLVSTPGLMELGRRRRLPLRDTDIGYLVHCFLGELCGDDAPGPFAVSGSHGRFTEILAYTERTADEHRRYADSFAEPNVHAGCDWDRFDQKRLPSDWPARTRLGFRVRVCPVVRTASDGPKRRKGAEVDAFLARCSKAAENDVIEREAVYREWFEGQVNRHGGASLLRLGIDSFKLDRVVRRSQGNTRKSVVGQRPDVTMTGIFEVTDSSQFTALLRRGIGRHRAFGFGMLLLLPVENGSC